MKVVLIEDVDRLGKRGGIKNVSDGYGRNFLIPTGKAKLATEETLQWAKKELAEKIKREEDELKQQQALGKKIDSLELTIKTKAEKEKLFGTIGEKEIMEALKKQGVKIEKSNIKIKKPIKEIGEYQIQINLKHGIEAKVNVLIEGE